MDLFDDSFDQPTDPRDIDPGGTPLPPVIRTDNPSAGLSAVVLNTPGAATEPEQQTLGDRAPEPALGLATDGPAERPSLSLVSPPATSSEPDTALTETGEQTTLAALSVVPGQPQDELTPAHRDAAGPDAIIAQDFTPGTQIRVPSGAKARAEANIAVIELLARLDTEQRPATPAEQDILACWSGWGAIPEVLDHRVETYSRQRAYLRQMLTDAQYRAAEASVLNAHYTDPAIAETMWHAVQSAGFSGGRVLEPGCGSGHFIGLAPPNAQMVGVENDPITAAVAAHLYPSAQIRLEGFETTRVPNGSFAAVVGNVPFGNFTVDDPAHNPQRFSIHNHFIVKSLDLTAPGGYVVVLTSHYTMDSVTTKARTAMAERAELLGAVRLPTKAFRRVAGTDVVTDILVLRRRDPSESREPEQDSWIDTADMEVLADSGDYVDLPINTYFHQHPENVLGTVGAGHGAHGSTSLSVTADLDGLADTLGQRLSAIIAAAQTRDKGLTATPESLTDVTEISFDAGLLTRATTGTRTPLYTLRYDADTHSIQSWTGQRWVQENTPKSRIAETRELIALRDAASAVIASQRDQLPTAEREQLRAHLNRIYDAYVTKHGPVNRFKRSNPSPITQDKHDERLHKWEYEWRKKNGTEAGPLRGPVPDNVAAEWEERAWRSSPQVLLRPHLAGGMRRDPGWVNVSALEFFDQDTGKARKATIFSVDQLGAPVVIEHADNIHDALAICLEQHRRVDVAQVARLLGATEDVAREQLRGLVYPSLSNPEELIPAVTAISGNVRTKLDKAREAAATNPIYRDYADALREVLPPDKGPTQISARPGAAWIPANYVAQFARETFEAATVAVDHLSGAWGIDCPDYQRNSVAMTETWGTPHRDAIDLLDALCNSKQIVVERPASEIERTGGSRIDHEATVAAQAKAAKISDRFRVWLFADEQRSETLVAEFNRRFNSLRAPRHSGSALTLPGLSQRFEPHYYQRDAVARIIAEPTVLLDHVVGAGKSGTMFMGAMELKRLGLVKQPWLVVPNHIIEQVGREAKWWYPAANVLMGEANTDAEGRRRLAAQSAATDWDMVIVPQSLFTAIGVSDDLQTQYVEKQLDDLEAQLSDAATAMSKKRIQAALKRKKARLQTLTRQDRKEAGLRFEQTGCDYLLIDEAHHYKNKTRNSQIEELACPDGSTRAEDLAMKIDLLRQRRRDEAQAAGLSADAHVERVASFATGTPIANSLGELFVMQDYLRPDLLQDAGVADINDWGATFTATINDVQVNATGTGLRPVTRVGKFCNLPELLALSSVFTDVVTRDQVVAKTNIKLPTLVGGQRRIVSIAPSQEVKDFIADLGHRASTIDPKRMDRDNILKISNDGRNVSLDPRLANIEAPAVSRASRVAQEIMRIHAATAENVYTDSESGVIMDRRGGLQIVFCDRGTPSKNPHQFTIYAAIRDELIAQGMEPEAIRFIHHAVKPADKLRLFEQCNRGEVSVLIGSTEKMGTGTNVQTRATALHHVDVPWRPADLEQREGRIIRQGNQNAEVEILNYVTEGSYDTVMWQKVEAKTIFIEQVKRNEVDANEVEDLGGGDLGAAAAETKAVATGDPRYIRQVKLQDEVQRLDALERSHLDAGARRDRQIKDKARELTKVTAAIDTLEPLLPTLSDRAQTPAQITIADRTYAERKDGALPLAVACRNAFDGLRNSASWDTRPVATINGTALVGRRDHVAGHLVLSFEIPSSEVSIDIADVYGASNPTIGGGEAKARGLTQRIENLYKDIPAHYTRLTQHKEYLALDIEDLNNTERSEFENRDELDEKRSQLNELTAVLRLEAQSDAAKAAAAAAKDRLKAAGREPGWTLQLNPTPAVLEESGYPDADAYRFAVRLAERHRAKTYREELRDSTRDEDRDNGDDGLGGALAR